MTQRSGAPEITTFQPVATLKRRAEFLRIRGGKRWACGSFVVECKPRTEDSGATATPPRIGYTVTKRMGNAVARNRIKRRLRAAVAALGPGCLQNGCDYVLIARPGALKRPFADLTNDLRGGVGTIHRQKRHSRGTKRG